MGKKVFKLFMETMLRAAVIILAVCIVVMLTLLIRTINKNKEHKKAADDTNKSTELVTDAADPADPTFGGNGTGTEDTGNMGNDNSEDTSEGNTSPDIKSAKIAVINSTGVQGVAGSWKTALESEGYTAVEVGNYLEGVNSTTQICVSGDYSGEELAKNFQSPITGNISELNSDNFDITLSDFDIVIVIGISDVK